MRLARTIRLAVGMPLLGLDPALAQSGHDLFQQALVQEQAWGNIKQAIQLYERIALEFSSDRTLAANALVRLGGAYEKLAMAEARAAYRLVIDEFADQRDQLRVARARLAAWSPSLARRRGDAPGTDPTYTFLLDHVVVARPDQPAPYDFSPDGRQVVFRDHRPGQRVPGLYIGDRRGTVLRPLITLDSVRGPVEGLWSPRWSPDGKRIAFTARFPGRDRAMGLYVIDLEGGALEHLGDSFEGALCWTPDGSAITYVGGEDGRLHTRTVTGQRREIIRGAPLPQATLLGGYSPDGNWLALDVRTDQSGWHERDIWIMAADGSERFRVTDAPGLDASPTWGADGDLYFVSDRSGTPNLWRLGIDAIQDRQGLRARARPVPRSDRGRALGRDDPPSGDPVQATFFTDAQVRYPRAAGDGAIAIMLQRVTNTIHLATAGYPLESHPLARGAHPQLSPDGRRVFFWNEEPGREGIFVVSRDGRAAARPIRSPGLLWSSRFHLSPDGTELTYVADADEGRAIRVVPAGGGAPRDVARLAGDALSFPVWSPDGSQIAFASGGGLYVVARDGGQPTEVARLRVWDVWSVRWSPDGRYLAALGWEGPGDQAEPQNHVYVVPASGGELRRLTPDTEWRYKGGLEWHPDGRRLTYIYYGVRMAYLDGRPTTLFIDEPLTWRHVGVWAPDGSAYYYYVSDDKGLGWGLRRRDARSGAVTEVSRGDGSLPAWSRHGRTMAWSVEHVVNQVWLIEGYR